MLEPDALIEKMDAKCPYKEAGESSVWKAAVRMLVRNGAMLCPIVASVRFPPLTRERAESVIRLAVVETRAAFEVSEGRHAVSECYHEGSLSGKVYCF